VTAKSVMEELPAPQIDGVLADDTLQLSAPPFSRVDNPHGYPSPDDAHSSSSVRPTPHTHNKTVRVSNDAAQHSSPLQIIERSIQLYDQAQ